MPSNVRVNMLGGLSVWSDNSPVFTHTDTITKPWQLLCYLLLNQGGNISEARLARALWPISTPEEALECLEEAAETLLAAFGCEKDAEDAPILKQDDAYICNPDVLFVLDTAAFEQKAKEAAEAEGAERADLMAEAAELYTGKLLPALTGEAWVLPLAMYYNKTYSDCVAQLCGRLYAHGEYNRLLAVATAANRIDPMDESHYLHMFRALYALEMYRAIIPAFHKASRFLAEELGAVPNAEVQQIYTVATQNVDSFEHDIILIKNDLREIIKASAAPTTGPLYCSYDVFKYLYQMVARSSERSGTSVVIVLLSLVQPGTDDETPAKALSSAMSYIKSQVMGGLLRKSDTFARYSKSQYIIMLSVDKAASAQLVTDRISQKCAPFLEDQLGLSIEFAAEEMDSTSA